MLFKDLGLRPEILRVLSEKGYNEPSPIQGKAIPPILKGEDVIACAQTGTGKTAGFSLPIIQNLSQENQRPSKPTVLILTPTRELASQVADNVVTYSKYLPIKTAMIFGGVDIRPQIAAIRGGVHILVATPGRLLDHVSQRTIDLSAIKIFVLDEADRMLDMGFIRDVRKIISYLPKKRQNLLFSATFSKEIKALAAEFLHAPALIEIVKKESDIELITQVIHPVDRTRKRALLSFLINTQKWQQVLVFVRTKHGANRLTQQLEDDGIRASAIHGNKSQSARTRALQDFKEGSIRVLVATDIAARGLDISQLPHVVNYELPQVPEDYVHRIGRTGRAGSKGEALSLVCIDEQKLLMGIERLIKYKIPRVTIPRFEVNAQIQALPEKQTPQKRNVARPARPTQTAAITPKSKIRSLFRLQKKT